MPITPLPPAPQSTDTPANFNTKAFTWVNALSTFTSEVNSTADWMASLGSTSFNSTSSTSLTVGTGSKSLTVQTGKGYVVGQAVILASTASPTNYMSGQVTSYDSGTGALVVNVLTVGGSGTLAAWTISVTALVVPFDPVGAIKYSYVSPGAGWLECNGAVYLQSSYASLYASLGLLPNSHNRQAQANMSSTSAPTAVADTPEYVSNLVNTGSAIVIVVSRLTGSTYSWAYRSTNSGVTWTRTAMPAVVGYGRLSFGNGRVIASVDPSIQSTAYATSDDGGSTWTARTWPSSGSVRDVVYGNRWVACRQNVASLWSDDGISWTAVTSDGSNEFDQAAFGNSVWSANRNGAQVISSDGKAWTTVSGVTITLDAGSTNRHRKKLLFAGGAFWAVGNYSSSGGYPGGSSSWQLLRSTDGQSWRQAYAPMRYLNSSVQTTAASAIDPSADFDNPHLFAGLGYLGIAGRTRNGIPGAVVTNDFVSFEYLYFSGHSSYSGNADLSPAPFSCNDKFGTWTWESSLNPYVMRETQARITYNTATQFAVPHIVPGTDGRRAYIKA